MNRIRFNLKSDSTELNFKSFNDKGKTLHLHEDKIMLTSQTDYKKNPVFDKVHVTAKCPTCFMYVDHVKIANNKRA